MRISVFRKRMAEVFGEARADLLASSHVFSVLGGRTVDQALEAGVPINQIWRVVCDEFSVPARQR